ncbi:MAG: hypothetical protein ACRCVD_03475, partial [Halioglobus sp.]
MRRERLCTSFQLLSSSVVIHFEDPVLAPQFAYIAVSAAQNVHPGALLSYQVSGTGPYEVFEEGQLLVRAPSAADVQFHVYQRVYGRALERYVLAGWIGLHAALVNIGGRRMMLLGDKGAGKTTLTSSLLFANHMIEGDELVLLREGTAMAFPRRLHLKPGIEKQIPELAPHLDDLPTAFAGPQAVRGLDPAELGFRWTINAAPIDHIIWIRANHGHTTTLIPLSSLAILQRLIEGFM